LLELFEGFFCFSQGDEILDKFFLVRHKLKLGGNKAC
jgi:hypothetical protein